MATHHMIIVYTITLSIRACIVPSVILLLTTFLTPLSVQAHNLPKLKIVTENLVPFQIQQPSGDLSGLSVEVIEKMFQALTITPDIRIMPWARAYEIAKKEANVLIFSIARTPHRNLMFHWVGCITDEQFSFWGLKKNYDNKEYSITQLKQHKIAVSRHSNAEQYTIDNQFENITRLVQEDQNMQMLFSARVDLIVATELTVKHRAKKLGYNYQALTKVHNANGLNNNLCIALSLGSDPIWIQRLTSQYQQLEEKGVIDNLRKKWLSDKAHHSP